MQIIKTKQELRAALARFRRQNPDQQLGFVPTMGFLHEGHLSLFRLAKEHSDFLCSSLFVNPTQFNSRDDYEKYPQNLEADLAACEQAGVDLLFLPTADEMLQSSISDHMATDADSDTDNVRIQLSIPQMTATLCGPGRPGHFEGVLYIVARFFHLFQPDLAVFGEKDFQQLALIKKMVQDLDFPIRILSGPTIRGESGLALSSRNARLSEKAREHAELIYRALRLAEKTFHDGNQNIEELREIVHDVIESGSLNQVEYVEIVTEYSLERLDSLTDRGSFLIAVAVDCDGVRLIDNLLITG